jgi:ribosome-binding protein aMBF1 (putative translation factor)
MSAAPLAHDDQYARGYAAAVQQLRQQEHERSRDLEPAPLPSPDAAEWETFGELLTRLRAQVHISRNRLAREAGCDPSYLTRIEHEERDPPRRHVVDALARVLFLNQFEYRQFVVAAGYAPVREWTRELEVAQRAKERGR